MDAPRGVFYIWGHSYEINENDWSAFEDLLNTFGHNPDAWYASQGDLAVWKWMRENVKIAASGNSSKLTITLIRPKLHPWWAARVPVALKVAGQLSAVKAGEKPARILKEGIQVEWR